MAHEDFFTTGTGSGVVAGGTPEAGLPLPDMDALFE